jgi:formylmethanofuran dehydrogenase subunit E
MADAIAAVTGCRLGKRTLKHMDYGKCACTFVDTHTGRAIRISAREDARSKVEQYAPAGLDKNAIQQEAYKIMPDIELFVVQEVVVDIPDHDQPGPPTSRVVCILCGEGINDRREVRLDGQVLCRPCAQGNYYRSTQIRKTINYLIGESQYLPVTEHITLLK